MKQVTERHFYQYAACPNWIYRDHKEEREQVSELQRQLQMDGLIPDFKRSLLAERGFEEVDIEDHEEAFQKTIELMEAGVQTILHGALIHGRYLARPDFLERVEGRSRFGDYYYVACDVKGSRKVRRETMLAGAFYADVLFLIQEAKPTQGYMMTPDSEVLSYMLESFEKEYHLTLHHIERVLAGEEPQEFLTSRCKRSPWFSECKDRIDGCDDLSRINRIWKEELEHLHDAGFFTVTGFAKASKQDLKKVKDLSVDRVDFMHQQANALVSGDHVMIKKVEFPKSKTELHFDIEADALRDVKYLFGVLEVKTDKRGVQQKKYHSFLAKEPSKEKEAWEGFVDFMKKHEGVPTYHYGWFEVDMVRYLSGKHGTDKKLQEQILSQLVDILSIMRPAVIFPLSFYALKDLAAYTGFSWRHPEASGLNSILWYEDWLSFGDKEKLQDILDYNEDDCKATLALKNWLMQA